MLTRMQRKGKHLLLMGVKTGLDTVEIMVGIPEEAKKFSTLWSSYVTLGYIAKGLYI